MGICSMFSNLLVKLDKVAVIQRYWLLELHKAAHTTYKNDTGQLDWASTQVAHTTNTLLLLGKKKSTHTELHKVLTLYHHHYRR
jgi:hypothetical protein